MKKYSNSLLHVKEKMLVGNLAVKEKYVKTQGYRIRLARKAIGLTQIQLAQQVQTTQQTIHDYEKNKRGSYADTHLLIKLSTLFEVTLDWLIRGKTVDPYPNPMPILHSTKDFLVWFKENKDSCYKLGLQLEDNSMSASHDSAISFKAKDFIVIASYKTPAIKDYVLAITQAKKTPIVFRQLLQTSQGYILKPINSAYPTILVSASVKIIAVAIEHRKCLS